MEKSQTPYKNLDAWKVSMQLVERVYLLTANFPKSETFGLSSQIRRAAISIPSNIAEGAVGRSKKHFINFLTIALGSLSELDTQIELSLRLKLIQEEEANELLKIIDRAKSLIFGLKKSLTIKINQDIE
ncbi:MAG: four helix bundle protein [Cyclobacteriaceae bacterium]|nr:four helix bundle protein [Cyclobacteriaceae bacterium]MCH8517806.1 four helix bundle protein [Cyclobacteriaceae bacterium]